MEKRKRILAWILPITIGLIVLVGVSYAWLHLTLNGKNGNTLKAGNLSLELDDKESNGITMGKALPMSDEVGLSKDPYHFTLTNNGNVPSRYTIYLEDVDVEKPKLKDEIIRLGLSKDGINISMIGKIDYSTGPYINLHKLLSETKQGEQRVLDTGIIYPSENYSYDLRLWIDSEVTNPEDVAGKVFNGKIKVVGKQLIPTPEDCFEFDESSGTIIAYLCGTYLGDIDSTNLRPNTDEQSPAGEIITDVVIPNTIKGTAVKSIGYSDNEKCQNNYHCSNGSYPFSFHGSGLGITSVVIPEGVTTIGRSAFLKNLLTSITIPSSVTSIGEYAFADNNITSVIIPSSVKSIESSAFGPSTLTLEPLQSVTIMGKSGKGDFNEYGSSSYGSSSPFHWLAGSECETYYNQNKSSADFGDNDNPCIHWEGKKS